MDLSQHRTLKLNQTDSNVARQYYLFYFRNMFHVQFQYISMTDYCKINDIGFCKLNEPNKTNKQQTNILVNIVYIRNEKMSCLEINLEYSLNSLNNFS